MTENTVAEYENKVPYLGRQSVHGLGLLGSHYERLMKRTVAIEDRHPSWYQTPVASSQNHDRMLPKPRRCRTTEKQISSTEQCRAFEKHLWETKL